LAEVLIYRESINEESAGLVGKLAGPRRMPFDLAHAVQDRKERSTRLGRIGLDAPGAKARRP